MDLKSTAVMNCKLDMKEYDYNTAADVDRDGEITAADARLILRAAVGLEDLTAI